MNGSTDATADLDDVLAKVTALGPLGAEAMRRTADRLDRLTKPPGSLGRLEALAILLAGITGRPGVMVDRRAIVVAAADHGVARHGVSAYPSEVTAQMIANFVAGGAAINVLAARVGAELIVVDVGVASVIPEIPVTNVGGGRLVRMRVRDGTDDMTRGPAMTREDALRAIDVGLRLVAELAETGIDLVGIGEMGIGNTTAASALTAVLTGAPPVEVTGRGTGIDAAGRARKIEAIERALRVNASTPDDPLGALAAVGGLEIAALVGVILGAAAARIPVVLDGFITGSAALVASALAPGIAPRLIAAHRSVEPGHGVVLEHLGLEPLFALDLRLGEGTGAALAMDLIDAAVRIRDEMATFESAAIFGPA